MGCAYAWNQGVRAAKHKWICIANNDIVFSKGCLSFLQDAAVRKGYTLIGPAYRTGDLDYNLEKLALLHRERFGETISDHTFNAACMLMPKSVFADVGYFDENFQIGKYEDMDFIRRLSQRRHKVGIAWGALIHHFGSRTIDLVVSELGEEFIRGNHEYFLSKFRWGRLQRTYEKCRHWPADYRFARLKKLSDDLYAACRADEGMLPEAGPGQ